MPAVVDWGGDVFADCLLLVQLFVSTCNRLPLPSAAAPLALADQLHFDDYKARLVRFPCKKHYIRITGFSFSFINWQQIRKIS